jgi:hypothetical protein
LVALLACTAFVCRPWACCGPPCLVPDFTAAHWACV